jgi:hypothetical protein
MAHFAFASGRSGVPDPEVLAGFPNQPYCLLGDENSPGSILLTCTSTDPQAWYQTTREPVLVAMASSIGFALLFTAGCRWYHSKPKKRVKDGEGDDDDDEMEQPIHLN